MKLKGGDLYEEKPALHHSGDPRGRRDRFLLRVQRTEGRSAEEGGRSDRPGQGSGRPGRDPEG